MNRAEEALGVPIPPTLLSRRRGARVKIPAKSPKPPQGGKRTIVIAGRKTSVSLEDAFWKGLKEIAVTRKIPLSDLVSTINSERQHVNLSSVIRLFVLEYYRGLASNPPGPPMTLGNMRKRLTHEER